MKKTKFKLSVVIPVYNGANTIGALVSELTHELAAYRTEIVLVNDGSKDDSESVCRAIALRNHNVVFISLRKNFGEHNAVICGLGRATGDYAVIIDDDFQNPPDQIHKLIGEIRKGYDVVYAQYVKKAQGWHRNLGSWLNDRVATFLLNKPRDLYLCSFKIIAKNVIREIVKYTGPFPYIDGLLLRVTDNIGIVLVEHQHRVQGKSNYTFKKLISLFLNMFFNFSIQPLRFFTFSGFIIFIVGVFLTVLFVIEKLIDPTVSAGWTSIALLILVCSGFQIVFLGLMGEYLGKLYLDQNGMPQSVIKSIFARGKEIPDDRSQD
jgi:glycosyltransferase involved in cell wall biosynthesis